MDERDCKPVGAKLMERGFRYTGWSNTHGMQIIGAEDSRTVTRMACGCWSSDTCMRRGRHMIWTRDLMQPSWNNIQGRNGKVRSCSVSEVTAALVLPVDGSGRVTFRFGSTNLAKATGCAKVDS